MGRRSRSRQVPMRAPAEKDMQTAALHRTRLREFVASVNTRKPKFGTFPVSTIQDSAEDLRTLHKSIEHYWALSKRHGFTNRTLYAGSLNAIRRHSDEILDIVENLQLLLNPRTKEILDRARETREIVISKIGPRGNIYRE